MNYTIIPQVDQFHQAFLFTTHERILSDGQIIPKRLLLTKNLTELDTLSFDKLRKIAKKLNIPGLYTMNKNVLSNYIRNSIVFE
jgi:hypothetical protein